jgi:AraC-like DNA-binding protein
MLCRSAQVGVQPQDFLFKIKVGADMKSEAGIKRMVMSRAGVGLTASILQRSDLFMGKFITDHPSLILVKRGKKILTTAEKQIVLLPGDAVAIAAGTTCDVQNETDQGQYEACWIVCSAPTLAKMETSFPNHEKLHGLIGLKALGSEFIQSFERGIQAIKAPDLIPEAVAEHRMQELLSWLAHLGFIFRSDPPTELQGKVRLMIGASPEQSWLTKDIAKSFAMSEATFRRKLADEGQSFSEILVDVRMTIALSLLQVSDHSIAEIAWQVGYESASRFAVRFKQRFGFSPSAIRGVSSQLQSQVV